MIPQSTARREAEEFARALDDPTAASSAKYAELTGAVALLRAQPQPLPRPEFVSDLRSRLMAAADEAIVPAAATPAPVRTVSPMRPHRRRIATLAAALTIVGGTAGVAAASQGTLPGDALYPVKRGLENIQLHLATNDSARGHDLLEQASTRMQEARELLTASTSVRNVGLAKQALDSATSSANDGAGLLLNDFQSSRSTSDVTAVRTFAAGQMKALGQIATLTTAVHPVASQLGDALAAIDQKARSLCLTCLGGSPALNLPSSISSLPSLALQLFVGRPTQNAGALEGLAQKAEKTAKNNPGLTTPPTSGPSLPTLPTPSGSGSPVPNVTDPVTGIIHGLTGKDTNLPGAVVDTVNGVVKGLGGTVSEITNGLGQTLGGLLGAKPTSTPSP